MMKLPVYLDYAATTPVDPRDLFWISGATESNNLAIKGAADFHRTRHLVQIRLRFNNV